MTWKLVQELTQSIISSIQNTGVASVQAMTKIIIQHTYPVEVINPVTDVKVKGEVKVSNQQDIEKQVKILIKEVSSLKKALSPRKNIIVDNFPKFPAFPAFPKHFEVSNLKDKTEVTNLNVIVNALESLEKELKKIELNPKIDVKAPIVNVPAPIVNMPKQPIPQVNVEKPDLSSITKILDYLSEIGEKNPLAVRLSDGKKFYKALEKMGEIYSAVNEPPFADTEGRSRRASVNPNGELQVTISDTWGANDTDEVDANNTYVGEESVAGKWRIKKIVKSGTLTNISYATLKNNPNVSSYLEAWTGRVSLTYGRVVMAL